MTSKLRMSSMRAGASVRRGGSGSSAIWASTALSYHAIIWIPFLLMVLPLPFMALARVAAAHQAAPAAVV